MNKKIKEVKETRSDKEIVEASKKLQARKLKIVTFFSWMFAGRKEHEYIRILQNDKTNDSDGTFTRVEYFNDLDALGDYIVVHGNKNCNTYFNLATTDGQGGAKENLLFRYCLAFDFDKKDLGADFSISDIIDKKERLQEKLGKQFYYHQIVDSGHGYHVYSNITRTNDLTKVNSLQEVLGGGLGADVKALEETQLLRVPYTFNIKDKSKIRQVTPTIKMEEVLENYHSISFPWLCANFIGMYSGEKKVYTNINRLRDTKNLPTCVDNMLKNGSPEHERNDDLRHMVYILKNQFNYSEAKIKNVCIEWDNKSNFHDKTDMRIEKIYSNPKSKPIRCKNCPKYKECWGSEPVKQKRKGKVADEVGQARKSASEVTKLSEHCAKKLRATDIDCVDLVDASALIVFLALKINVKGSTREVLIERLTYKGKMAIGETTITKALQDLENMGYVEVEVKKNKKFYKVKRSRVKEDLLFDVHYSIVVECSKGNITKDEVKFYVFLKYLLHLKNKESKELDNISLRINQEDIAKEYGISRPRVSGMIKNLIEQKVMEVDRYDVSEYNGHVYNTYLLTY